MYDASSEARNSTAFATSSTRPSRPSGTCSSILARTAGSAVRPEVRIGGISPGCTELTRILCRPCCTAPTLVIVRIAPFDALGGVDAALPGDTGDRRDIDDRATANLAHLGDRVLHPEKRAARVDVHDLVPGLGVVEVLDRAAADPGIVDQDVELAEFLDRGLDDIPPVGFVGDVEMLEARRAVGRDNLGDDLLALVVELVGDRDLGAFARENARGARPHARRGAGDQRNLAFEAHGSPPLIAAVLAATWLL